jgi:hypothetical protein
MGVDADSGGYRHLIAHFAGFGPRVSHEMAHLFRRETARLIRGLWPTSEELASCGVKVVASATLASTASTLADRCRCPVPVLPCAISERSCGCPGSST